MPTGYTAKICDNTEKSFESFLLRCTRAFGACVMQRDDSPDELPTYRKVSDYYSKTLAEAEAAYNEFLSLDSSEIDALIDTEYEEERKRHLEHIQTALDIKTRLENMKVKVLAWTPPTNTHKELKKFMLSQIDDTIKFDGSSKYWQEELEQLEERYTSQSINQFRESRIKKLEDAIKRANTGLKEEQQRCKEANDWLDELYGSIGRTVPTEENTNWSIDDAAVGDYLQSPKGDRFVICELQDNYRRFIIIGDDHNESEELYYEDCYKWCLIKKTDE
jgi:hypothetical protein